MYHACSMLSYFIDGAESQEEIENQLVDSPSSRKWRMTNPIHVLLPGDGARA